MASGRSLSAGGSYGRAQAILNWAADNWRYFDAWCCIKGIDPLDLSAYRFHNLAMFALKENLDSENLEKVESALRNCDKISIPWDRLQVRNFFSRTDKITGTIVPDSPTAAQRHSYIPPWWRGEEENAKIALSTMGTLPKEIGGDVRDV